MTHEYEMRSAVDKFLLDCAPQLGFYSKGDKLIFITSESSQVDLKTMELINVEDCVLVEDAQVGAVEVAIRYNAPKLLE